MTEANNLGFNAAASTAALRLPLSRSAFVQRFKILQIASKRLLVTLGQATSIGNPELATRTVQLIGTTTMNCIDVVQQQVPGGHAAVADRDEVAQKTRNVAQERTRF